MVPTCDNKGGRLRWVTVEESQFYLSKHNTPLPADGKICKRCQETIASEMESDQHMDVDPSYEPEVDEESSSEDESKLKSEKEHLLFLTLPDLHKGTDGGTKSNVFFGNVSKEGGRHSGRKSLILAPQDIPDISWYQLGIGCQFVKAPINENPGPDQKIFQIRFVSNLHICKIVVVCPGQHHVNHKSGAWKR